jgi:predicted transcriptional regulator
MQEEDLIALTADIVSAHVGNNHVAVGDLGILIQRVHGALTALQEPPPKPEPERRTAAVSARASVKPDYLVRMECGARQKTLKRHLAVAHGVTPAQYRAEHGLPASYPMAAPNYSEQRRALAKSLGLGRKTGRRKAGAAAKSAGGSARPARTRRRGAGKGAT